MEFLTTRDVRLGLLFILSSPNDVKNSTPFMLVIELSVRYRSLMSDTSSCVSFPSGLRSYLDIEFLNAASGKFDALISTTTVVLEISVSLTFVLFLETSVLLLYGATLK